MPGAIFCMIKLSLILLTSVRSHKPILTIIPTSLKQFTNERNNIGKHIQTHNVNEETINAFSKDFDDILSSFNFNTEFVTHSSSIRYLFSTFYDKLSEIYCRHISVDKVLTSKRNSFDKPWITTGIAKACKVKNKLHDKWIKSRGSPVEDNFKKEYKFYRSRLRKIMREAELNHFRNKFSKACGNIRKAWQVINTIRCKKRLTKFSNVLCYVFNSCILSGVFPNELKIVKVIPLYKSGNSNCMSNYRPISILPTISKIFEKLLHKRIYNFLEDNNIIYDCQFGFRQGHSTIHAVQTAISSVITSLNSSYHTMEILTE